MARKCLLTLAWFALATMIGIAPYRLINELGELIDLLSASFIATLGLGILLFGIVQTWTWREPRRKSEHLEDAEAEQVFPAPPPPA